MRIQWRYVRDTKKRYKYSKKEYALRLYKSILDNERGPLPTRLALIPRIHRLKAYESRIKNRCIITNRGRGVVTRAKVVRHILRSNAHLL